MPMTPTYLPFVRGIQDADADSADTQNGKLSDAVNVHVHPERANVLSLRPRFIGQTQVNANSRVFSIGGKTASTLDSSVYVQSAPSGGFNATETYAKFFGVESIRKLTIRGNDAIFAQAYVENSSGDTLVLVSQGNTSSGYRTYYQITADGERMPEVELGVSNPSKPGRLWAFPRTGGGWVVFYANGNNTVVSRSTTNWGAIPSSVVSVSGATEIRDILQDGSGNYAVLYENAGALRVQVVSELGAVVTASVSVIAKSSSAYAGMVSIGTGVYHVWSGGFPVDGNDTIYCHRVTPVGATVTLLGSIANAVDPVSGSRITVGGGPAIKLTTSSSGAGSYCYLSGGNGQFMRVGRLFLCNNTSITQSTYTAPILPMGRLWCDDTFFGARIWGTQNAIAGCWELTPTTSSANDVVRCVPIAYVTVTGANLALDLGDPIRQFCVLNGVDYSVCAIPGRDYALSVVRLGYNEVNRCTTVNNSGFDLQLGALPRYWDGVGLVPVGIPQAPLIDSASVSPGTGTVPAGTYVYSVVWEWFDGQGRRQQSPSQLKTAVVASASSVILEIHPCSIPYDERLLGSSPAIRGVVYRTDAGGTLLKRGELYLQFTTVGPVSGLFGATQFLITDDGTVDFATGEPLYTSAGGAAELASTAMEEAFLARPYSDRFIGVSKTFPDQLWYTKTLQVARGIEPNQALYFRLPEVATGLAVQDGNIYWFSAQNCYAFVPQFADDTGAGGGGIEPVPLAPGVGCMASNSIVETPVGVFFIGPRGPWAIPRGGGAPTYVGAEVEQFFREFPTCRGAVYNSKFSEVVFAMEADNLNQNHCLIIYNHLTQQWYRWMIGHDYMADQSTAVVKDISSAVFTDGKLTVAGNANGTMELLQLTDDYGLPFTSTDDQFVVANAREIHPYIETKNFMPHGGPAEQFRANRIALDAVFGDITIASSRSDGSTWDSGYVFEAENPIYRVPTQKCRSVRFRFYTTWNGTVLQDRAPVRFNGVTLYTSPLGRAQAGSVQYRG